MSTASTSPKKDAPLKSIKARRQMRYGLNSVGVFSVNQPYLLDFETDEGCVQKEIHRLTRVRCEAQAC